MLSLSPKAILAVRNLKLKCIRRFKYTPQMQAQLRFIGLDSWYRKEHQMAVETEKGLQGTRRS